MTAASTTSRLSKQPAKGSAPSLPTCASRTHETTFSPSSPCSGTLFADTICLMDLKSQPKRGTVTEQFLSAVCTLSATRAASCVVSSLFKKVSFFFIVFNLPPTNLSNQQAGTMTRTSLLGNPSLLVSIPSLDRQAKSTKEIIAR